MEPVDDPTVTSAYRVLENHPDYRVLRRLVPRDDFGATPRGPVAVGIVVDTETTGTDLRNDRIVELALLRFEYCSASGEAIRTGVEQVAKLLKIGHVLGHAPRALSNGQKQRTALARALVGDPDFLYFDEPFTALDAALRKRMQDLVVSTVSNSGKGGLFITHDLHEALRICHRIAVLDRHGQGILDCVTVPETPGNRSEEMIFETARRLISDHPLFAVVDEHDERRLA